MRIFNTYEQVEDCKPYCIALGSFDGVHVGHQKLIKMLKENAKNFGCASMIYTFAVHPRKTLKPDKPIYMITNNCQRAEIIEELEVDVLFLEDFKKIMDLSAEQFFHDVIIAQFHAKCLIVGYNYRFGKNGEGDTAKLIELGSRYDIKVEVVPPVLVNENVVSSSLIRHKVQEGSVYDVVQYLGRPYIIQGNVIHGKQNGKAMGIRTANLEIGKEAIIPLKGVYITDTKIDGTIYKSITNVGTNPTFKGEVLTIETHILDFEGDLYDRVIEVFFLKRLRDEILFHNINDLVAQIKSDIDERMHYKGL